MNIRHSIVFSILIFLINISFASEPANPRREMRAVWIASVANIDWPSRSGLSTADQQRELTELLDLVKDWNLNTVILQIRPAADAFFASPYEPWSQWLTGKQGQAPTPFYDPLAFAIQQCRERGIDIHLWLNPYRAEMDTALNVLAENHPKKLFPEMFVTYGKISYFNPGLPQTRDHVARVVGDLVRRYDMDAIHFDDYFYPYPIRGLEFPDSAAFALFPRGYSPDQKDDWRRDNVDLIIKQLKDTISTIKPHVEFGISPFGVWRNIADDPRGSQTRAGASNYDHLYADILKWQKEGWIDYVTPQLYWHIGMEAADYATLAHWWSENTFGCPLYIGQALYRISEESPTEQWRDARQIALQLDILRAIPNIQGSMYFSAKHLRSNPLGVKEILLSNHYRHPALPPVNNRVKQITIEPPVNPLMIVDDKKISLLWERSPGQKAFVVYKFRLGRPESIENAENIFRITGETSLNFDFSENTSNDLYYYMITALSATNQESVPVFFNETTRRSQ
jgi:uncharacterized lipoprotein YddW (UPF0748 family)